VETMDSMFSGARVFDQSLGKWDTSEVRTMFGMFAGAEAFDGSVEDWDTSAVENLAEMFRGAKRFNRPIDRWDLSSAETLEEMFRDATSFRQSLDDWRWRLNLDVNTRGMFRGAEAFRRAPENADALSLEDRAEMPVIALEPEFARCCG